MKKGKGFQKKRNKCKVCNHLFWPKRSSMERTCSPPCAIIDIKSDGYKVHVKKVNRKEYRKEKEKIKTIKTVYVEEQKSINAYVRERDKGKGCISCDSPEYQEAGHFFAIGSKYQCNPFRLDARQIMGQCTHCNHFVGGGNRAGYERGIIERYGQEYLDNLYKLKYDADNNPERWTKEDIRQYGKVYRKKTRDLKCS